MNKTEAVTHSVPLDELSLDQLVQLQQGLGHQIEALREQRAYLAQKVAARLAAGERNSAQGVDGAAPGALIEVGVSA